MKFAATIPPMVGPTMHIRGRIIELLLIAGRSAHGNPRTTMPIEVPISKIGRERQGAALA
jgi:hypothetical protein